MRKALFLLPALAFAVGCDKGPELLPGFEPPPAPDNGMQIITPIVRGIQPGSDNELCTWTDIITDRDLDLKSSSSWQSATGHHIVLYRTEVFQPAGTTRPCTDDDMATFRFVVGSGGEGRGSESRAPGNLVYRIPRGSQLVVNQHFLNPSTKMYDGQSSVNLYYADPGQSYIPSGSLAVLDTNIRIPPGEYAVDIEATMQRDQKLWFLIPHMHRWGKQIRIDMSSGGERKTLFDTAWQEEFTFHPPEMQQDPAQPMLIKAGDKMHVRCEWQNDTAKVLTFGFEMCVAFAQTVDDNGGGNMAWDGTNWVHY